MSPLSLFNPWVILGLLLAFIGVGGAGYAGGHKNGADAVQNSWDRAEKNRAFESQRNAERVRETDASLQAKADQERKTNAATLDDLRARAERLAGELSKRPARPAESAANAAQASGPRPDGWGTGAGLYRDDAMLLAGKAQLWQEIRLQRDACYRAYGEAQAELKKLSAAGGGRTGSP